MDGMRHPITVLVNSEALEGLSMVVEEVVEDLDRLFLGRCLFNVPGVRVKRAENSLSCSSQTSSWPQSLMPDAEGTRSDHKST
jgi:hypothetical protein